MGTDVILLGGGGGGGVNPEMHSTPSSGEKQNFKACYMLRKPG